ncbi:MAG: magnesium transporter [Cellvibrionaceae bacterium]|jgi:magnesium transporter
MQTISNEQLEKTQASLSKLSEIHSSEIVDGESHFRSAKRMLKGLTAVEIARLIEASPPKSRRFIWQILDQEFIADILQELPEEVAGQFATAMDTQRLADLTEELDVDDVADILQQLPDQVVQEVLASMSVQNRQRVETVLSYEKDTAGGLMDTDVITVRPRFTLDVVLRYLRRHEEIPSSTDQLVIVNADNVFLGTLSISKLLTSDPTITVREVMKTDNDPIPVDMSDSEVAKLFEQNNWISAPVVNEQREVVGRITIDDVVDVIIEDANHSLMSFAGLDEEEETFAPLLKTVPRRAIWLGINLITAVIASAVINLFQDTIEKVVALAILMPIVASMGGIAGSQTLTVVIRGIALGQIGASNSKWLLNREILSSLLNGMLWSTALALLTAWWFDDIKIAVIIAVATIINLLASALGGTLIPLLLKRMSIDPALAGGVVLTTITDVVGFVAFLGLATLFYV